jgi:aspartate aminotransferase-like enzyme
MINHRGPEFVPLLTRIVSRLKPFFGTQGDIEILSCVGTGGLEAAVVNALSPGDTVVAAPNGVFGDRFADIAELFGASVTRLPTPWGQAVDPIQLRALLEATAECRAVLLTHNETSTGVLNPLAELTAVVRSTRPEALVMVDTVSAVGSVPFEMDAWGVDIAISASQKGWMAAPGAAIIAVSERGWNAIASATTPRFYFDLVRHRDAQSGGMTAWTPALAVLFQIDAGLELMTTEGPAAVFERHESCAAATRAGLTALGFDLFAASGHRSPTVTAALVAPGEDWPRMNRAARERGVVLAEGLGPLAGRIFRIGHLGSVTLGEILDVVAVLEDVSVEMGRDITPGAGVAAALAAAMDSRRVAHAPEVAGSPSAR